MVLQWEDIGANTERQRGWLLQSLAGVGGLSQGNGFALFLSFMSHPQPVWHQVGVGVAGTQDPVLSPCPQHWGCHRVLGNGAVGRACPAVELSAGGRANPAAVADESIILMLSFELCFFGRREVG